ncbi:prephenate dehydratase [Candidatus Woesearchaeota archaeon]|nr:prephenate dehydratase [Candidatus Woesearchaeota archaeon]
MITATLGPEGTFSHEAALKKDKGAEIIFKDTVRDIFEAVSNKEADKGVVPVENSVSGTIGATMDALLDFDLNIEAEVILHIKHNLAGHDGMKNIKTLYVHPATYEQCERFIRKNIPKVKIVHTSSNAESARMAARGEDKAKAAIVPKASIEIYQLKEIKKEVQDNKFNTTRFAVISRKEAKRTGRDRTSIAIYPQTDKPGLLYGLLGEFAKREINLTKIESRPSKGKLGDYIFFIDMEGSKEDERIKKAFKAIEGNFFLNILGSYPREY